VISENQFAALSEFRFHLAQFLRFSERAARAAGIMPTQYLLLLHIRGFSGRDPATVGELAQRLQSSPHGTVALINRCARLNLVGKRRNADDARRVEVYLTARGRRLVERIAERHRDELQSLRNVFRVAHVS
jgi:DNA-binding MarR family transcriptional regulator